MRRAYGNRGRAAAKPVRAWMSVSPQWNLNLSSTTATSLVGLEAPTGGALTSDPPEELIIMRLVGSFNVSLAGSGVWSLALIVQDSTWTPGASLRVDQDKRILWSRQYGSANMATYIAGFTAMIWEPPGLVVVDATTNEWQTCEASQVMVDIAPKVKLAPGQSLYLVAYEETGTATLVSTTTNMRLLYQRSRRR